MNYGWNIWNWIQEQVPGALRDLRTLHWLYALLRPVRTLHAAFLQYRADSLVEAAKLGQVIVMEWALNGVGTAQGTIFIADPAATRLPTALFLISEQQPSIPMYLISEAIYRPVYLISEYDGDVEFEVWLPLGYTATARLTAEVNRLKPAGMRWRYQTQGSN